MSLMEFRKERLKFEISSLTDSTPVDPEIGGSILPLVQGKNEKKFFQDL